MFGGVCAGYEVFGLCFIGLSVCYIVYRNMCVATMVRLAVWAGWVVLLCILGLHVLHFMWVWLQGMLVYCRSLYLSDMSDPCRSL